MIEIIKQIFPYFIGISGFILSFYTLYKTINHQREIKSVEIKKELRTKLLDDFIETYCDLVKKYKELDDTTSGVDFRNKSDEIESIRTKALDLTAQIDFYTAKMYMLLTKRTKYQLEILSCMSDVLDLVLISSSAPNLKDSTIETTTELIYKLINKKDDFKNICSAYVEKERTEIENLITKKPTNKFTSWLFN